MKILNLIYPEKSDIKYKIRPNGSICMDCGEHIYYCICEK